MKALFRLSIVFGVIFVLTKSIEISLIVVAILILLNFSLSLKKTSKLNY